MTDPATTSGGWTISRPGVAAIPRCWPAVNTGRRLALPARHGFSARRGLIVSAAAGTGKTTAIPGSARPRRLPASGASPGSDRFRR